MYDIFQIIDNILSDCLQEEFGEMTDADFNKQPPPNDTSQVRDSLCGLKLMEESTKGIYIGPKDWENGQADVFISVDQTHLSLFYTAANKEDRELSLSRSLCSFITAKEKLITDGMNNQVDITFGKQIDRNNALKITTSNVPKEMIDLRIWFKNCVGRWAPSKKGARLHYIHMLCMFEILKSFLE